MQCLAGLLRRISEKTQFSSVFLYGSRVRGEHHKESDWELGVLFKNEHLISECDLRQLIGAPGTVSLYPYDQELFLRGEITIPFQRSLYLREIKVTGKTLMGERVVENFSPPPITIVDLLCDLKFALGRASDALISFRRNDKATAASLFFKSCMFATRDWIVFKQRYFPVTYREINDMAIPDYTGLIGTAYGMRTGAVPDERLLLDNVFYINAFVEKQIELEYRRQGNFVLIP